MTGTGPTGTSGADDDGFDPADPDAAFLTALLTDLADDPDAPPSSVTPLSVIAAARRAAAEQSAAAGDPADAAVVEPSTAAGDPADVAVAEPSAAPAVSPVTAGGDPGTAGVDGTALPAPVELRPRRRRRVLGSLLAAACLVGGALIIVPIAVNGNSSTSSSSAVDSERIAEAPSQATAAPQTLASVAAGSAAGGSAPAEAEAVPPGPDMADPAPGMSDSGSAAGSAAADAGTLAGCWPLLDDAATASLIAAVPEVAFSRTAALTDPCDPDAVAGLALSSAAGVPDLLVRVTSAAPDACAAVDGGCEPVQGGGLVGIDPSGTPVAYAYADGVQIAVAAPQPPVGSGLTASQAVAAAEAVAASVSG